MGGVYQYTINRYKVMTFLEQFISWAASEINYADSPNERPTAAFIFLDNSI